jgi:hypothetical protein
MVTQVQFFVGGNLLGTFTNAPYGFAWTNPPIGTFNFSAIASDNSGLVVTSSVVNVSVSTNLGDSDDAYVRDGSYSGA